MSSMLPRATLLTYEEAMMKSRRRFQQGSIKDAGMVWIVRWRVDEVRDGQIVRCQKQERWDKSEFPTRAMVKRELNRRLGEVNSATYRPRINTTFAQFAAVWQEKVMIHLAPSTIVNYRTHIDRYLLPFFGPRDLRDIRREMVQTFVSSLQKSPKTVRNIFTTLQAMWRTAEEWEYVDHDIRKGIRFSPLLHRQRFFFSAEEIRRILAAATEPHRTFYGLAAETGLRAGELAGLRVEDVDITRGVIFVAQSVWRGRTKETKSRAGTRLIELSSHLVRRLGQLISAWHPNDGRFLFAYPSGHPWVPDLVLKEHFHPLLRQLGIAVPPGTGFHAFRHANATMMDSLGAPDKVRQTRLGHSSIDVTKNIYTHVTSQDARRVADELGEKIWSPLRVDVNAEGAKSNYLN